MLKMKLILGTVQFGMSYGINNPKGQPQPNEVFDILDLARKEGIDTLDTAEDYGNSQEIIGQYNVKEPSETNLKIISKLSHRVYEEEGLITNLSKTLSVLQVSSLEGYLFHSFDNFVRYPALMDVLVRQKEQGKIRKIGVSIYGEDGEEELILANPHIDLVQLPFNLLNNNNHRRPTLERLKAAGKEIHSRSVFLQGAFFMNKEQLPAKVQGLFPYITKVRQIADNAGISIEQLALQYACRQPLLDKVLIGVDSPEHLQKSVSSLTTEVPDELFREVDAIFVKEAQLLYPKNW